MKKEIVITFAFLLLGLISSAQVKPASYWTAPSIPEGLVEKLAKHQLLIIDYENLFNDSRARLDQIKALNPKIIFLAYTNQMEIWAKDYDSRPVANKLKKSFSPKWQLKDSQGRNVVFYPDMLMMNLTTASPKVNNQTYGEFYVEWLLNNVLNDPLIDGYFMDNGTSTVSWVNGLIDADNDGRPDNPASLDRIWRDGMIKYLQTIKSRKGADYIIVTNKAIRDFSFINDGTMSEKFPNDYVGYKGAGGWYQCIENARRSGQYNIFQVDLHLIEFGVASSLLLDNVYVAMGQNIPLPGKYNWDTGKPTGPFYKKSGIYYRDFEKGKVIVDPEKQKGQFISK